MSKIAATAAALTFALAGSASIALAQDYRSPDARPAVVMRDFRSPDAHDAARTAAQPVTQDLRSPDARESGRFVPAGRVVPAAPQAQPSTGNSDWIYLAIGGLLSLMVVGSVLLIQRRRSRVVPIGS